MELQSMKLEGDNNSDVQIIEEKHENFVPKEKFSNILKRDFKQTKRIIIFNPKAQSGFPNCLRCHKIFLSEKSVVAHMENCKGTDFETDNFSMPPPLKRGPILKNNSVFPQKNVLIGPPPLTPIMKFEEKEEKSFFSLPTREATPPLPILGSSPKKSTPKRSRKKKEFELAQILEREPSTSKDEEELDFLSKHIVNGYLPVLEGGLCCVDCHDWIFSAILPNANLSTSHKMREDFGMTSSVIQFLNLTMVKKWFICPVCELHFRHLYAWQRHLKQRHNKYFLTSALNCGVCPKGRMAICYDEEMHALHGERAHPQLPNKKFLARCQLAEKDALEKHSKTRKPRKIVLGNPAPGPSVVKRVRKIIECPYPDCRGEFRSKVQLDRHWAHSHRACPFCGIPIKTTVAFRYHLKHCEDVPKNFKPK